MTALLILFVTSFGWVFIQAFQSRNVNSGQYGWAACTSFVLGTLQVAVLSTVIGPNGSLAHTLLYCAGGSLGVVSAMWAHRRFIRAK